MKYLIGAINRPKEMFEGSQMYLTGDNAFIHESDELKCQKIDENTVRYTTGLNEEDIKNNGYLTKDEQNAYLKILPKVKAKIKEGYGEKALKGENKTFWENKSRIKINNDILNTIFDDENIDHLIMKWNIIGGGFDIIAPTFDIAKRTNKKYYLSTQEDYSEKEYEEEYGYKRKAMAALDELIEQSNTDAIVYLTWLTVDSNHGFTRNTPKAVFEKTLMEFIEGKHVKVGKKQCAKTFYDNYQLWKANKEDVMTKAVLTAAHHFGMIYFKEGKFRSTKRNTILGSTIDESIEIFLKPENHDELKTLKKDVEERFGK